MTENTHTTPREKALAIVTVVWAANDTDAAKGWPHGKPAPQDLADQIHTLWVGCWCEDLHAAILQVLAEQGEDEIADEFVTICAEKGAN